MTVMNRVFPFKTQTAGSITYTYQAELDCVILAEEELDCVIEVD